jgi:uncharacterized protein YciI
MYFVFTYESGPAAIPGQSISEQPSHRAWIQQLYDDKRLLLAGPFVGETGGMAIVEAHSKAAAEVLLAEDPAIINRTFTARVRELNVIYR